MHWAKSATRPGRRAAAKRLRRFARWRRPENERTNHAFRTERRAPPRGAEAPEDERASIFVLVSMSVLPPDAFGVGPNRVVTASKTGNACALAAGATPGGVGLQAVHAGSGLKVPATGVSWRYVFGSPSAPSSLGPEGAAQTRQSGQRNPVRIAFDKANSRVPMSMAGRSGQPEVAGGDGAARMG